MTKQTYTPHPIDTKGITLPPDLDELLTALAENTHENWARLRIAEGWTFGPVRDDAKKQTPCLVPYGVLSDTEKNYDREIAAQLLKTIVKLGYTIALPEHKQLARQTDHLQTADDLFAQAQHWSAQDIFGVWKTHDPVLWQHEPRLYLVATDRVLKAGEPLLAFDILAEGLQIFPDFPQLAMYPATTRTVYLKMVQQQALALSQSGAYFEAQNLLTSLREKGATDGETAGLMGRNYKSMAAASTDDAEKRRYFTTALEIYTAGFNTAAEAKDFDAAYYNGVNAASMALLAGDESQSQDLAQQVREICLRLVDEATKNGAPTAYWLDATLGEIALLLNDLTQAQKWYTSAAVKMGDDIRGKGSMRMQAQLLLRAKGQPESLGADWLPMPSVAIFSGHMVDLPTADRKRFPPENEAEIGRRIGAFLDKHSVRIGYASAACGADILFLEEVLRRGGEINIILPFEQEKFRQTSVERVSGGDWGARFEKVLPKAAQVKVLTEHHPETEENAFEFANLVLCGLGISRAEHLGTEPYFLAVWDGHDSQRGSTASAVALWRERGFPVEQILPGDPPNTPNASLQTAKPTQLLHTAGLSHHTYLPMLFGDVKGYSQLNEREVGIFSTIFMGKVGALVDHHGQGVLSRRTMGDGLFFVFRELQTAVDLALDLQEMINQFDWTSCGLPANLRMRVSLDAGPCYSYRDSVVDKLEFCGNYVVRAARMEPITPPGHIYASETFTALSRAKGVRKVLFRYAGQISLPKNYGRIPAYHLERSTEKK